MAGYSGDDDDEDILPDTFDTSRIRRPRSKFTGHSVDDDDEDILSDTSDTSRIRGPHSKVKGGSSSHRIKERLSKSPSLRERKSRIPSQTYRTRKGTTSWSKHGSSWRKFRSPERRRRSPGGTYNNERWSKHGSSWRKFRSPERRRRSPGGTYNNERRRRSAGRNYNKGKKEHMDEAAPKATLSPAIQWVLHHQALGRIVYLSNLATNVDKETLTEFLNQTLLEVDGVSDERDGVSVGRNPVDWIEMKFTRDGKPSVFVHMKSCKEATNLLCLNGIRFMGTKLFLSRPFDYNAEVGAKFLNDQPSIHLNVQAVTTALLREHGAQILPRVQAAEAASTSNVQAAQAPSTSNVQAAQAPSTSNVQAAEAPSTSNIRDVNKTLRLNEMEQLDQMKAEDSKKKRKFEETEKKSK